jgi:phi13 family phage major tail protein
MAKIGLRYPVYSPATETDSAISYGTGAVLAKAISANISIENNDVKLYADDAIAESDNSFASGTVTIGIDDLYDTAKVALLDYVAGDTVDVVTGAKELSVGTASPAYVGFGFYGKVIRNKVSYWRAIWLKKVQFAEPSDELATKGESVEFGTPELEGTVMMAADGKWKEEATFSTEAGAKAWLDGKCGLAAKCAPVVSSVASGTYTDAQSVTLTCATESAAIYYTDDGTIPSATNGTLFEAEIELSKPSNTCIKAVATKAAHANSDILELYITVA